MITLLILVVPIVYLAVGIGYARKKSVDYFRDARAQAKAEWNSSQFVELYSRSGFRNRVMFATWLWPIALLISTVTAPVERRRVDAEQARTDAAMWASKRFDGTPAEREMAAELARVCAARAKELEL